MAGEGIVLEMTDVDQLRPSVRNHHVHLSRVPILDCARIASLYRRIWQPIGGGGRSDWTQSQWATELAQPGMAAWVAHAGGVDIGVAQLGWSGHGDAAIIIIGVLPAHQGQGIGGDLLTRLTHTMWVTHAPNGTPTHRVWVWTVPGEHPHTIANYTARGYTQSFGPPSLAP